MNKLKLEEILRNHYKWITEEEGGKRANLEKANLNGVSLCFANLQHASMEHASLIKADLRRANLTYACLLKANLQNADLNNTNFQYANLRYANFEGTDIRDADFRGADLKGAKGINKFMTSPLHAMKLEPGPLYAYKLVNAYNEGAFKYGLYYNPGSIVSCEADKDEFEHCSFGINLATLDWCIKMHKKGLKILQCEFMPEDIAAIPLGTDGKFRVSKCKVLKEIDLKEIGL